MMVIREYKPEGVCCKSMKVYINGNRVASVEFEGGCLGNLQGIAKLVEGMEIQDVIKRIEGISCGNKPTSCPDQLARALRDWDDEVTGRKQRHYVN